MGDASVANIHAVPEKTRGEGCGPGFVPVAGLIWPCCTGAPPFGLACLFVGSCADR